MAERFFTDRPLGPGEFVLEGDEFRHAVTVRRLRPGDRLTLFNGDGREYPAEVLEVRKREAVLAVAAGTAVDREPPRRVEVACAVPKGDRADFMVEKLTELGVARLVPLRTARSVVHPRDAKLDRLRRGVVEASKQCGRNTLMEIAEMADFADLVNAGFPGPSRLAHPAARGDRPAATPPSLPAAGEIRFAVGPEGGFADEEVALALAAGWGLIDLGPRVLRVETAAAVLAAAAVWDACG